MVSEESERIRIVLIAGGNYLERELQIVTAFNEDVYYSNSLQNNKTTLSAILLEGLPTGNSLLTTDSNLILERLASGCFCCVGQLVMMVTLHRIMRKLPRIIYICMIDTQHLSNIQMVLSEPPYQTLLKIEKVIQLP